MKKILSVLLLINVLVLAGCSEKADVAEPADTTTTGPSSVDVTEQETPVPVDTEPVTEPEPVVEEVETVDSGILKLIEKTEKVDSLYYEYSEFIAGTTGYYAKVWLKDSKAKHRYEKRQKTYLPGENYDTAYIDLSTGNVDAYCETVEICGTDTDSSAEVDIKDNRVVTETPFDVLEEAKKGKIVRSEMVFSKDAKVVRVDLDGGKYKLIWIETFRGMPMKYEVLDGNNEKLKSVGFENMVYNTVKDSDVTK